MSPRPWVDRQVDVLLDELGQFGLGAPRDHLAALVRDRVAVVAAQLRITETSARRYLGDDELRQLARALAVELADEHPGADVLELPRTVPVPVSAIGRTVAALAEAGRVCVASGGGLDIDNALGMLSALGLILHEHKDAAVPVRLPPAALTRAARVLEAAADMLRSGTGHADWIADADVPRLAASFARDAEALRGLAAEHGPSHSSGD